MPLKRKIQKTLIFSFWGGKRGVPKLHFFHLWLVWIHAFVNFTENKANNIISEFQSGRIQFIWKIIKSNLFRVCTYEVDSNVVVVFFFFFFTHGVIYIPRKNRRITISHNFFFILKGWGGIGIFFFFLLKNLHKKSIITKLKTPNFNMIISLSL